MPPCRLGPAVAFGPEGQATDRLHFKLQLIITRAALVSTFKAYKTAFYVFYDKLCISLDYGVSVFSVL